MGTRKIIPSLVAVILAVLVASGTSASAGTAMVVIRDRLYPADLTVAPGTTITWRNDDATRHRMRTTSGPTEFDSNDIAPGGSFQVTLSAAGTYRYVDHRSEDNSAYWGTIQVTGSAPPDQGGPPPPPPPPGGGAAPGVPPPPAAPVSASVRIVNRAFSPAAVTVAPGGTVSWSNEDDREHTVTGPGFDSGVLGVGAGFQHSFPAPGTYQYRCLIHPDMTGTVSVPATSGEVPAGPGDAPADASVPAPGGSGGAPGAGAGAPVGGVAGAAAPLSQSVDVVDFAFAPDTVTVAPGGTVNWRNAGSALHTVTARDGSFDSGFMSPGGTFAQTFAEQGTFLYACRLHPQMQGTVLVTAAGQAAPPPAPDAPTAAAAGGANPAARPGGPASSAPGGDAAVQVVDFSFTPAHAVIPKGANVTWTLSGAAPHTITANDGSFDSGLLNTGATYRRAFAEVGTYSYHCLVHPQMNGVVEVVESAAAAATRSAELGGTSGGEVAAGLAGTLPESASGAGGGILIALMILALPLVLAGISVPFLRQAGEI